MDTNEYDNINILGKYIKGAKTGIWTTKKLFLLMNGGPVKKTDLIWGRVPEDYPLKEVTLLSTENWSQNHLQGLSTMIRTEKKSWGYPSPGGSTITIFTVKSLYDNSELISIDANRKKNEKIILSFKGSYKNNLADGSWQFNDGTKLYSYKFISGNLQNYVIKKQGTGEIIESEVIDIDTALINSYNSNASNSFDVKYGKEFSNRDNAKLFLQKINENLSLIKLCYQEKEVANFKGLNIGQFTGAFGDITPFKNGEGECLAHTCKIKCEVFSETNNFFFKINFPSPQAECKFLSFANSKEGVFLNRKWSTYVGSDYMFQLKSFLYANNIEKLREIKEIQDYDWYLSTENFFYEKGMNDAAFFDFWKMIKFVVLKDEKQWKSIVNQYFNTKVNEDTWQKYLTTKLDELKATTIDQTSFNEILNYLNIKEDELEKTNEEFIASIKEVSIGNQIWMSSDLNILTLNNPNYIIIQNNKIQNSRIDKGIVLYNLNILNKNICPNGWRIPTKSDFTQLVSTLGGDLKTAADLMLKGKGSGFETDFPIIDGLGRIFEKAPAYVYENESYLCYDPKTKTVTSFDFNGSIYNTKVCYLPCRCIKE